MTTASGFRGWLTLIPDHRRSHLELKALDNGMIFDMMKIEHVKMLAQMSIVVSDPMESIKNEDEALEFLNQQS
jgi:hypothetical protein